MLDVSQTYHAVSAASTNAANVKAGPGAVTGYAITNTNAATRYVCLHNNAATPTPGSAVALKFGIPGGGAANVSFLSPIAFNTGIGISMVANPADTDATAVALNDLVVNLFYL